MEGINTTSLSDSNIDIEQLAETVFLGPQAEVLLKIDDLNERWNVNIGLNKKFGFKPGAYDQVKDLLHDRWLQWNKKNSGLNILFRRIDTTSYHYSNIKREFEALDVMLRDLRADDVTFQDNSDEALSGFNFIKERLNFEQYNIFEDVNIENITLNTIQNEDNLVFSAYDLKQFYIEITIKMTNSFLKVNTTNNRTIQEMPMDPITIKIKVNLLKCINTYSRETNRVEDVRLPSINTYGGYNDIEAIDTITQTYRSGIRIHSRYENKDRYIQHPYISRRTNLYSRRGEFHIDSFSGQCFGDLNSEILSNIWSLDLPSLLYNLKEWNSRFIINQTNPLNKLKVMYHGSPSYLTKEYIDIIGKNISEQCDVRREEHTGIDNVEAICNKIECTLRDDCSWYLTETVGVSMSPINQQKIWELFTTIGVPEEEFPGHLKNYNFTHIDNELRNIKDNLTGDWCKNYMPLAEAYSEKSNQPIYTVHWMYGRFSALEDLEESCFQVGVDVDNILNAMECNENSREERVLERVARLNNIPFNLPSPERDLVVENHPEMVDESIIREEEYNENPF